MAVLFSGGVANINEPEEIAEILEWLIEQEQAEQEVCYCGGFQGFIGIDDVVDEAWNCALESIIFEK